jgi:F-type H+/Na+-transporting ATPase subunit alpha
MYVGSNNLLRELPLNKVRAFEEAFYIALDAGHKGILENLRNGKLDNADLATLKQVTADVIRTIK